MPFQTGNGTFWSPLLSFPCAARLHQHLLEGGLLLARLDLHLREGHLRGRRVVHMGAVK